MNICSYIDALLKNKDVGKCDQKSCRTGMKNIIADKSPKIEIHRKSILPNLRSNIEVLCTP